LWLLPLNASPVFGVLASDLFVSVLERTTVIGAPPLLRHVFARCKDLTASFGTPHRIFPQHRPAWPVRFFSILDVAGYDWTAAIGSRIHVRRLGQKERNQSNQYKKSFGEVHFPLQLLKTSAQNNSPQ